MHLRTLNSNRRTPATLIPLGRQNLIIMRPQLLPKLTPSIKMILDRNLPAHPLNLPHGPKLLKRRRPINTGLIGPCSLQNIIRPAVRSDGALLLGCRARVVGAIGFDDVVLDQGVAGPAVERNVGVDVLRGPGSCVVYYAVGAGVPAFSGDEVADVGPLDVVL